MRGWGRHGCNFIGTSRCSSITFSGRSVIGGCLSVPQSGNFREFFAILSVAVVPRRLSTVKQRYDSPPLPVTTRDRGRCRRLARARRSESGAASRRCWPMKCPGQTQPVPSVLFWPQTSLVSRRSHLGPGILEKESCRLVVN
jgi:hypothetical protein